MGHHFYSWGTWPLQCASVQHFQALAQLELLHCRWAMAYISSETAAAQQQLLPDYFMVAKSKDQHMQSILLVQSIIYL